MTLSPKLVHKNEKQAQLDTWPRSNQSSMGRPLNRPHAHTHTSITTSQVDFEVDRPPPAHSPPGDLLTTMVKETVILYKKGFRKMKKVGSLIDVKVMKTRNDCEIGCDCVKHANVVLHVGLCKEILARKHTATHKPTPAQPLIVTTMTHIHKSASRDEAP